MPSSSTDVSGKRKRSPSSHHHHPAPPPPPVSVPVSPFPYINYAPSSKRLRLIEGDSETFKDLLGMIDDYEGVLHRHESLAANLGAKLVGPLLLKSLDKIFDGDIKIIHSSFALDQTPPTWLDLVTLARSNAGDFVLADSVARAYLRGGQIQISEDDYRLIMSGAPERMIPSQPIPEDEAAELGTLGILEARLAILIKKADVVASKARQLNYHIGKHKATIQARSNVSANGINQSMGYTHHPQSPAPMHSPAATADQTKLQQDLLKQFTADDGRQSPALPSKVRPDSRRSIASVPATPRDSPGLSRNGYRALMTTKVEKLPRGDPIDPPCDRCRRLKFDCTKNLTACTACTKKHAKCSWADITDEELSRIQNGGSVLADSLEGLDMVIAAGTTAGQGHGQGQGQEMGDRNAQQFEG